MQIINNFFNSVFAPLIAWSPQFALVIMCFILTLITTLVYKYTTNQQWIKQTREEMKELQKQANDSRNNPAKMAEIQRQIMEKNMKFMMHSFKPLIYTFIPLLLVFGWIRSVPEWTEGKILLGLSWIWVYVIFSMLFSTILRKVLKIY
jgi:uncharacterized membrane protein (DUF106 family)